MNPARMRTLLAFSLLINFGVLAAASYRALDADRHPDLPRYLQLDERQLQRWHEAEETFLAQLGASAAAIGSHRDRMIQAIFADSPDPALIDGERAAIARLQDEQQKRVIEQLLRERELLSPAQRARLAQLLLAQPTGPSPLERLHRD